MSKCRSFDPLTGNSWEWSACRVRREVRRGMVVPLSELVPAVAVPEDLARNIYVKLSPHCAPAERLRVAELSAALVAAALQDLASAEAKARKARRPRPTGHVVPRRPKRVRMNAHGWGRVEPVGCASISSDQERAIENLAFSISKGD